MKRWSHLHSIGTGALLMALTTTHTLWTITITLTAGIIIGRSWASLGRGAHHAGALVAAKVATERERRGLIRAERRRKLALANALRERLEKAYERGFIEGKLDS